MSEEPMQVRCTIEGEYKGVRFTYTDPVGSAGSQFIYPDGDTSTFWWIEGNMACDCNRAAFLPPHLHAVYDAEGKVCGEDIIIHTVTPIGRPDLLLQITPKTQQQ